MHPLLDLQISIARLWPCLPSAWRLAGQRNGEGWDALKKGSGVAYRPIRVGLKRYWVVLRYNQGKTGLGSPYKHFSLTDQRPGTSASSQREANIGAAWFGSLRSAIAEFKP